MAAPSAPGSGPVKTVVVSRSYERAQGARHRAIGSPDAAFTVATALSYRLLVLILAAATAGLGVWAFVNLPVDAYPNIAQTQVKPILKAPA